MKNSIIIFAVLILFSCGGSKDEEIAIIPPEEKPMDEDNLAPSVPILVYPSNELLCIDNQLEFTWEASTDVEGDAISYSVQVANDEQFTDIISETTSSETKAVIILEKGKTFFWRALATDSHNNHSNYSPSWKFYTEGEPIINQLPFQPELINPKMNDIVSAGSIMLSWNSSDPDNDHLMYDVYFGTVTNVPLVSENLEVTSYEVSLAANSLYYWRIVIKDGAGGTTFGPIWGFRTE